MTKKITDRIQKCDSRMLRYMTGVTLAYRVASEKVDRRCGIKPVLTVVRKRILRWFGHVMRREGERILGEMIEVEVPQVRPRRRRRKPWKNNIEDSREMNLQETDAMDRDSWRAAIKTAHLVA